MVVDCGCRKGRIKPGCDRHDPMRRINPGWWLDRMKKWLASCGVKA